MTIEKLEEELKENKLNSIYVLYGEEKFLLETVLKKIKKIFGHISNGINYIQIDENNIEQSIYELQTPSFGYEKKLVLFRNIGIVNKDEKKKKSNLTQIREELNKFLIENKQYIQKNLIIIFIEENIEKTNIIKTIESLGGVICNFEIQKSIQIEKRLKSICNAYKVKIDTITLKYFIEKCGQNMQLLINEIRKIIEYTGENGTIDKNIVDLLAIKTIDSTIFDLTDNIGKKNISNSMQILRDLLYSKEPIQKILITLYNHFKKLYIVILAQNANRDITEILNLKPNQSFLITKYKNQSKYFSETEIRKLLDELIELDYKYKIGNIDINIGLESILCRYCS